VSQSTTKFRQQRLFVQKSGWFQPMTGLAQVHNSKAHKLRKIMYK